MAIASEITKLNTNLTNSYTACQNKGATIPTDQNFDNLATCISTIPSGSTPTGTLSITANGTYDVTNYASANVSVSGNDIHEYVDIFSSITFYVDFQHQVLYDANMQQIIADFIFDNSGLFSSIRTYWTESPNNILLIIYGDNAIYDYTAIDVLYTDNSQSTWIQLN